MMADCPDKYETRSITGVESPGLGDCDSSSQAPDYHDDHRLVVDELKVLTLQIVGGTLGGVVLVALSLVLLFLYQRRRGRKTVPYATGPLQVSLPMSKEALTSKRHSLYGLSFSTSAPPSTDLLIPLPHNSRESRLGSGSR
ncbi:hypothetical protein LshimejAT787_1004590 [Lyophyllum shimeji]|uniref:Uncharacterized protein n=1 Tax=Lyophyllum shimeji TaxID=47721 RepID=A0A9P3UNQ0_LYOSH|nr:hypothetical protein LshimejAT787_1004590 [Lyophyllum shimeji]